VRGGCAVFEVVDVVGAGLVARGRDVGESRACLRAEVRVEFEKREWDGE
jgi:hypothetical protein